MKLTQSPKGERAEFYRDMSCGKLVKNSNASISKTEEVISQMDFKRSMKGRILKQNFGSKTTGKQVQKNQTKGKQSPQRQSQNNHALSSIVDWLIGKTAEENLSIPNEDLMEAIKNEMTHYGKNISLDKEKTETLYGLFQSYYNNEITLEEFKGKLLLFRRHILSLMDYKIERLSVSIDHNKVPFVIDESDVSSETYNKLKPNTRKSKWLFHLAEEKTNLPRCLDEYQNFYQYDVLKNALGDTYISNKDKPNLLSTKLYETVISHHKNLLSNLKEQMEAGEVSAEIQQYFSLYLYEVRDYFRLQFPVKIGTSTGGYRQAEKLKELNLSSAQWQEATLFTNIHRRIVNKIVNHLILYGKLTHYFYTEENGWEKDKISSTGLQEIQIEEAFKKQVITSVTWAVSRLNFLYDYNGEVQRGSAHGGDILLDSSNPEKDHKKVFLKRILEEPQEMNKLEDKLYSFYPMEDYMKQEIFINEVRKEKPYEILLAEITNSVAEIRNNIFHFQKGDFFQFQKNVDENVKILYRTDLNHLQEGFREQIRGTGLALYYPLDLLKKVMNEQTLTFHLYAPGFPLAPSFKKLYDKGKNLYMSSRDHKGLHWYPETQIPGNQSMEAYRNFLQLIYYHAFLPAVQRDEKLITYFINQTKKWNKEVVQRCTKNQKEDINAYRYHSMPDYNGSGLVNYMKCLQKDQSKKEKEISEGSTKTENYFTEFVQDIYVFAFDNFLEQHLKAKRRELQSPERVDTEEETLEALLGGEHPVLKIQSNLSADSSWISFYLFLKLLEGSELNRLQHQFIRYRTTLEDLQNQQECMELEELIQLVLFSLPIQNRSRHLQNVVKQAFSSYVEGEDLEKYENLYFMGNDGQAVVVQKSMAILSRSGVMALYQNIFKDQYKVTINDYNKYRSQSYLGEQQRVNGEKFVPSPIEIKQQKMKVLHRDLVKYKGNENDLKGKISQYKSLVKEVSAYNNLRRKLTFESLFQLYELHMELLGRYVGFSNAWERDQFFLLTALSEEGLGLIRNVNITSIFTHIGNEEKGIIAKLGNELKANDGSVNDNGYLYYMLNWYILYVKNHETLNSGNLLRDLYPRNIAAHLNLLTQKQRVSLVDFLERLRTLMNYDLKKQNAVTQVFFEVLKKYHFKVQLVWNGKSYILNEKLESEKMWHLKNLNENFSVPYHSEDTLIALKALLDYKDT